ncbi:MAG: hypothetical protein ACK6AD_10025 [Cyanobacteriota bacterium]|jgi:hypothetical protein
MGNFSQLDDDEAELISGGVVQAQTSDGSGGLVTSFGTHSDASSFGGFVGGSYD